MASSAPALAPRATRRVPITVVIPTLNEAARIGAAVRELAWADEIIVVDAGSTDETRRLAKDSGAQVMLAVGNTIGTQRNLAIQAARNEWILALDADERLTPELRDEIARVASGPPGHGAHEAYRIRFRNHYLGRELKHGPWGRDWHVRLFTRDRRFITRRVHEHLDRVDNVGTLRGSVLHDSYRDIGHHASKIITYSRWGAADLRARGRRARLTDLVIRPWWRFVRDYILYSGWRDGAPGLIAAVLSAFAAFMKYAFLFTMPARDTRHFAE
ncbi:MAG TPA: glycosyltransferase family 2 protein [Gemmatimonadaceae bacterium]